MRAGACSLLLVLIVQLTAGLINGGVRMPQREAHASNNLGAVFEGVQLTLRSSTRAVPVGNPLWVSLKVKNVSKRPQTLVVTDPEKLYSFTVKKANGGNVPLTEYGKRVREASEDSYGKAYVVFKPEQERTDQILINRIYDMGLPGRYLITAKRLVFKQDGKGAVEASSNTFEVIIMK